MDALKASIKFIALFSAIIATVGYYKYAKGRARYFLYSIWLIVLTEFSYKFVYYRILDQKHSILFVANIYFNLQFLFYIFWFRYLIRSNQFRNLLLTFVFLFAGFSLLNSFVWQDFFLSTQTYTYIVGTVFTIIAISLYFYEVFNEDFILHFQRSVFFWFSLGVLLFHIPFLPFWLAAEFFNYSGDLYSFVIFILNLAEHGCFVIGVLWSKRKYNC